MSDETTGVGDCLGNAGPLPAVTWEGKVYRVYRNCPAVVGHMELNVAVEARTTLRELRPAFSDAEYADRDKALADDLLAGKHKFGGPLFMAALTGPRSAAHLLAACVQPGCPGFTVADAVRMLAANPDEVTDALILAVPDFFLHGADAAGLPRDKVAALVDQMVAKFRAARAGGQPAKPKKKKT